jgi:hypothetical protein
MSVGRGTRQTTKKFTSMELTVANGAKRLPIVCTLDGLLLGVFRQWPVYWDDGIVTIVWRR